MKVVCDGVDKWIFPSSSATAGEMDWRGDGVRCSPSPGQGQSHPRGTIFSSRGLAERYP